MVQIKRIYDKPSQTDGFRILIDRLWPRGISKEKASIDLWLKDIAPSTNLRQWFNHQPDRFEEFSLKYIDEILNSQALEKLRQLIKDEPKVTLLYATKETKINHAVVLKQLLDKK